MQKPLVHHVLQDISEFVELVTTRFRNCWFRGQSKQYGVPQPSIHRYLADHPFASEFNLAEDFKRLAPTFSEYTPDRDDHLGWLILMQHHRAPTRLLDWSENPLAALYFAVADHADQHGELWILRPDALTKKVLGKPGIALPHYDPYVRYLAAEPFHPNPDKLRGSLELETLPSGPIPFYPTHRFRRIGAQAGVFTIHPTPAEGRTLDRTLKLPGGNFEVITINGNKKRVFQRALAALGLTHLSLFPDLDGLAATVAWRNSVPFDQDDFWSEDSKPMP